MNQRDSSNAAERARRMQTWRSAPGADSASTPDAPPPGEAVQPPEALLDALEARVASAPAVPAEGQVPAVEARAAPEIAPAAALPPANAVPSWLQGRPQ